MTKETAKIALGTWSWGVGGFAGGDAIFGNQLDTRDLKEVFEAAVAQAVAVASIVNEEADYSSVVVVIVGTTPTDSKDLTGASLPLSSQFY